MCFLVRLIFGLFIACDVLVEDVSCILFMTFCCFTCIHVNTGPCTSDCVVREDIVPRSETDSDTR